MSPSVYRLPAINFSTARRFLREIRARIPKDGDIQIDAGALEEGKTLAVCALVECKREAAGKNCRMQIVNLPPRLQKLAEIYQITHLLVGPSAS